MQASALLDELLQLAALGAPTLGEVEIRGGDPVLPTRYRIGATGAAAIAASALAAARLWKLRAGIDGTHQSVSVDLRHAVAALRSARYLQIDGAPLKEPFDALSGLYAARDGGWVFLHCNFPNHRAAVLGTLALPDGSDRDAVTRAVSAWDARTLEDAVHSAGGAAGCVRSAAQWSDHPQFAALASLPLLEIERLGDAPREPLLAAERPLSGVRVLDLARVLAGPTCARTLAEHGADVLRISGPHLPHSGEVEIDTGLGKRSAFLDLREARDRDRLTGLVCEGRCDVFSQAYRPDSLAARGFGPDTLARLRPGIVYVELSAWGRAGPWASRRGFDTIVQCVSGMAITQGGDGAPRTLPVSAIDYVSGYLMAFGAMVALMRRATEGGSWRVRVSLARTGRWIAQQGLLDVEQIAGLARELPPEEIARICQHTPSPFGLVRHLAPVARMSHTPPRWERPPVPLGHDAPLWT